MDPILYNYNKYDLLNSYNQAFINKDHDLDVGPARIKKAFLNHDLFHNKESFRLKKRMSFKNFFMNKVK